MAKASKRVRAFQEKVDRSKVYPIDAALALLKEYATAKFNESIDVAVQLGVDPKKIRSGCSWFRSTACRYREDGSCCCVRVW